MTWGRRCAALLLLALAVLLPASPASAGSSGGSSALTITCQDPPLTDASTRGCGYVATAGHISTSGFMQLCGPENLTALSQLVQEQNYAYTYASTTNPDWTGRCATVGNGVHYLEARDTGPNGTKVSWWSSTAYLALTAPSPTPAPTTPAPVVTPSPTPSPVASSPAPSSPASSTQTPAPSSSSPTPASSSSDAPTRADLLRLEEQVQVGLALLVFLSSARWVHSWKPGRGQ